MTTIRVLLTLLFVAALSLPALAERRIALVIGNSQYQNVPQLANPARDAAALAQSLTAIGFETDYRANLNRSEFEQLLAAFGDKAEGADVAVVYFAGHGIEVDGENYLIPVDARLSSDRRARFELLSLDDVLASLDGVKGLRAVFLDACRSNPFLATMSRSQSTRSIGQGFTAVEARNGTIISYAAKQGTVAADGLGPHSPYASALLSLIGEPGLEVQFMLRKMRDEVLKQTNGAQEPYVSASISGEPFYFVPPPPPGATRAVVASSIQQDFLSTQAIGTAEAWQAFLNAHSDTPSDFYMKLALEAQRKALADAAVTAATQPDGGLVFSRVEDPPAITPGETAQDTAGTEAPLDAAKDGTLPPQRSITAKPAGQKVDRKKNSDGRKNASGGNGQQNLSKHKVKPPKPPVNKAASKANRPNATRYSYKVWDTGQLRSGHRDSRSTPYGTLSCTSQRAFGTDREINRFCRWE